MATTNHLDITLVEQSQAQKEVTVNQAIARIDAVLNTGAVSRGVNTPPGSPAAGDVYIIGASPTGDWTGQASKVAYYDQIWRFIAPREGMMLWVNDENKNYTYDGSTWATTNNSDLDAIGGLSTTGIAVRTGSGTWNTRNVAAGTGISVSNGSGVAGNPTVSLNAGLSNLTDATISGPANGEMLVYSSSAWRNTKGMTTLFYNTQSGTTYTLLSTDAGKTIYFTNASAITLTLPNNLSVGANFDIVQAGAGQVTFTPAGGANRRNRQSHTKTAGQWAVCKLQVVTNSGGTSAEYVLSGDTAA